MVVAAGFEGGGHRPSFLRSAEESLTGTIALVPQIVDKVRIPVIAAGGIADGSGIAAALMLGASAAQVGTAFLACDESGASDVHRQLLFQNDAKYTGLSRAYTGRLARGFYNRFAKELKPVESQLAAPLVKHHKAVELLASLVEETTSALRNLASSGNA